MQIPNVFTMDKWEIKSFLAPIIVIQSMVWLFLIFDYFGFDIPILRPLVSFIYLGLVPGILIIRMLRLHKLDTIESILCTVGLSISFLMFTGFATNLIYPFLGISKPLSILSITMTISVLVTGLILLCYWREKNSIPVSHKTISLINILNSKTLFLLLLPFLSILGAFLVKNYNSNLILMFLMILIVLVILLIAYEIIPDHLYPLAIFTISLSLLYQNSLITDYLWGFDIHAEYYFSNLVISNSYWSSGINADYNSMLSIVMLGPIFSMISGIELKWVFKIIYPLFYSLVPLGMYYIIQKQTNNKIAFLSVLFLISGFTFYSEVLAIAKQQIAELFYIILLLLLIENRMDKMKKSLLFIIFGFSLTVSHYGLSYIFIILLISSWVALFLVENRELVNINAFFLDKNTFSRNMKLLYQKIKVNDTFSANIILLFFIFALTWYLYISGSSVFQSILNIGSHVSTTFIAQFLNPEFSQGLNMIGSKTSSPLHSLTKCFHIISQIAICIGFVAVILGKCRLKFKKEYIAFALFCLMFLVMSILVPYVASSLNVSRIYHISIIVLAPFAVIGFIFSLKLLNKIINRSWNKESFNRSLKLVFLFFSIFLLLNTGFVYEITQIHPNSISLSQNTINKQGDIHDKGQLYNQINTFRQDSLGAQWLAQYIYKKSNSTLIYSDQISKQPLKEYINSTKEGIPIPDYSYPINVTKTGDYVFLGYPNLHYGVTAITPLSELGKPQMNKLEFLDDYHKVYPFLTKVNKIYSNGGCEIYISP